MNPDGQFMHREAPILNSNSSLLISTLHPPILKVYQSGVDTKGWRNLRISHEPCLPLAPIAAAGLPSCVLAIQSEDHGHDAGLLFSKRFHFVFGWANGIEVLEGLLIAQPLLS